MEIHQKSWLIVGLQGFVALQPSCGENSQAVPNRLPVTIHHCWAQVAGDTLRLLISGIILRQSVTRCSPEIMNQWKLHDQSLPFWSFFTGHRKHWSICRADQPTSTEDASRDRRGRRCGCGCALSQSHNEFGSRSTNGSLMGLIMGDRWG